VSYADASRLGLLVAMTFWAAISALGMTKSVHEADAEAAWVWVALYAGSSLLAGALALVRQTPRFARLWAG
jgi:hypothetical protein